VLFLRRANCVSHSKLNALGLHLDAAFSRRCLAKRGRPERAGGCRRVDTFPSFLRVQPAAFARRFRFVSAAGHLPHLRAWRLLSMAPKAKAALRSRLIAPHGHAERGCRMTISVPPHLSIRVQAEELRISTESAAHEQTASQGPKQRSSTDARCRDDLCHRAPHAWFSTEWMSA
jgi:hypothetical protein